MDVINTSGRRKNAVARLYMSEGKGEFTINSRDYKDYFPTGTLQYKINQPFNLTENAGKFDIKVNVAGGGITGQAEAVRLAISKALVELDADERKKFGQRKARKKVQFSKR